MVERFSMNPVSCKLLNEAWKKEFPDEVAIAERMLALLDELEHYKSREERVTKLVMDNSTSWDALYKKLEAAERRIAELDKRLIEYAGIATREARRVAELEALAVSIPEVRITVAESKRKNLTWRELGAYNEGADVAKEKISKVLAAAGVKVKGE
ncbi:ead/Ea22-like family protein [Salmonella enterica subsp. enterica serovar Essen]|nr:ead/Ea22-like family protein [Salmonella enterica subsp. enterica serovar Essen]